MEDEKRITTAQRRYYAGTNNRLGKYGYIVVSPLTEEQDAIVRKITPIQRKCIILYYVKTHNFEHINVAFFAKKLGCEVRTIQYDLRYLQKREYLMRIPSGNEDNDGRAENIFMFKKDLEVPFYRCKPTLRKVYGKANYLGLREWHWDDYKTIPGVCDEYHDYIDKVENFEELTEKKKKQKKLIAKAEYDNFATFEALQKRGKRYVGKK